jgi:hypothetical protein
LDSQLQPILASVVDSFILNSFSLVYNIKNLKVPDGAYLVTIDITSLYSNIPTHLGIKAMDWALNQCPEQFDGNKINFILRLLKWILDNNYLEYRGKLFRQTNGTAMGTPVAPLYAIIFMGYLEQKHLWPR